MTQRSFSRFFALATLALSLLVSGRAMSVLPPSFNELVDESAQIVRGEVVSSEAVRSTTANGTSVIKTRVTWALESSLKGGAAKTLTLEFLGGRIGTEALEVPGMPRFKVGEKGFVFVSSNTRSACPIVAAGHGHFRIVKDASGLTRVARHDGTPLRALSEIKAPLLDGNAEIQAALPAETLTDASFEAAIRARVSTASTATKP